MAKITALTAQKRDPERVNVFLDGEFALGLAASVALDLRVGQELTLAELEQLEQRERLNKAKQTALSYVSLRPRSEYEVRTNLRRKAYEEEMIDQVVDYLLGLNYLDDEAFARYWVEQRETFRPRSRFALSQELRKKGVQRELIDAVLEQVDETAAAHRAAEKKVIGWSGLPEQAFKQKLAGFLQRRGFSYDVIRETLEATWQMIEEETP